ncbi:MAG: UDP-N-acetylmuramoyl-L-alanine--D-glutamate ligase [Pseudomonadota bacterium]
MIALSCMAGRNVALFGLGGSGIVTARALMDGGATLTCFDDNPNTVAKAAADGIPTADLRALNWSELDALVLAPGVPLTHPKPHWSADLANAAGVEIIGDVELFCRQRAVTAPSSPLVAITGTNGKSTTTALIAHVLQSAGKTVAMGGNIGVPVLRLAEPSVEVIHVVECSSYQIDLAPGLNPTIGVLLNISSDHLDRHGTLENYAEIKTRLVTKSSVAVVGVDDTFTGAIADDLPDCVRISVKDVPASVDLSNAPSLRGEHNLQNALAARAVCLELGLSDEQITAGFASFPGLAHRMQIVGERDDVLFVNDSKATNADAAAKSLASFSNIRWIVGGLAKEGGIGSLKPLFPHVSKAYLIGESAPDFASVLGGHDVPYEISSTLDVAVKQASAEAAGEDVVLLAPAAASFDQFPNFEKRGDAFVAAVKDVIGGKAEGVT